MVANIGVIGLGVMGSNIALNIADHGYRVAVYNHHVERVHHFVAQADPGELFIGCENYAELCAALHTPRLILMMVTAGPVVDEVIEQLLPHLQPGDVLIDGGNSFYRDTERRLAKLARHDIRYVGMGISGGEEGARHGPAIMPGGDAEAWPLIRDIFRAIAARTEDGEPCCRWVGSGGAGHYVKMVHNGIEYGDMQLIAEAWDLLHRGLGLETERLATLFAEWNQGRLSSYLIEITAEILRVRDPDGTPRVLRILDTAGQKGTGRWTVIEALKQGVPLTLIAEAVFARALSARKAERERAAALHGAAPADFEGDTEAAITAIGDALYAAKIVSYAQGFMQLRDASERHGWNLAFADIALLWRAGCIIRSRFLNDIAAAFARDPGLPNLLFDEVFGRAVQEAAPGWRETIRLGVQLGIPLPALSAALAFYDGWRSAKLPANLLQAQRDYFGAHNYRRLDRAGVFHTHWTADAREECLDE